mmetsp:Transcript_11174/g.16321  ORF Transcript_11174/g.16321 Transcript_11174/m.16321 type:complete len:91 (+) Transcript_11174:1758-2030(+)
MLWEADSDSENSMVVDCRVVVVVMPYGLDGTEKASTFPLNMLSRHKSAVVVITSRKDGDLLDAHIILDVMMEEVRQLAFVGLFLMNDETG